jgi:transposase, IS5 family
LEETGEEEVLKGRCDSFVVETDVHYPTDINLLWDAMRKLIIECGRVSHRTGLLGWGKYRYNLGQIKRRWRQIPKLKHSTSSDEKKQAAQAEKIGHVYRKYLKLASSLVTRAEETLRSLADAQEETAAQETIELFVEHAHRQIDQIDRRVLQGEKIPHEEKVFSLFEPHSEWISKGKAGVPVELGLNTCIIEDQYGYILHHRVMQGQTDDAVAVPMVEETQARFPTLKQCSFDAGFYTPANQKDLRGLLAVSVLPQKGRLSPEEETFESSQVFIAARRQHAAVESAINALEVHGLDRCPDHGIDGFKRYVALAVLARNIQQLGAHLNKKKGNVATRRRKKAA